MTQEKLNEILDTLDWERDNLHFIESSPRDEWTERNAKRKRITIQALKMASEALERQMPKKPNNDIFDEKRCPICLERATFQTWKHGYPVTVKMKFCQNCGQAIDWSEE